MASLMELPPSSCSCGPDSAVTLSVAASGPCSAAWWVDWKTANARRGRKRRGIKSPMHTN